MCAHACVGFAYTVSAGGKGFSVTYPVVQQRGSIVNYICAPDEGVGSPKWTSVPDSNGPPYEFIFEWRTQYACPIGGGGGGGGSSSGGGRVLSVGWILVIW
jgi:hypothetical protein